MEIKKYIYKITNLINGKVYIGQTIDLDKRKSQHFSDAYHNRDVNRSGNKKLLYRAMEKYGKENFSFEQIDGPCTDYNDKEKYWIKYYKAYIGYDDCNGYNETEGGEEPPILRGENNPSCTHSNEIVDLVIYYLTDTNLSSKEISELTNYDDTAITKINNGTLRRKNNLVYPLRQEMSHIGLNDRAEQIIFELLNTNKTQKQIAEEFNVARTMVTAINRGQNHYNPKYSYPIRSTTATQATPKKKVAMLNINNEIIKIFDSVLDAGREIKGNNGDYIRTQINKSSNGIGKAYNYYWKYIEE